ncbi:hypothetical protein ACE1MK_10835 [Tenacibaculum maritimum]|uniref:hypothetical protein n=1 Tax=Tenacibaculum maritimum TaxID=107401 RepID=UPI0012E54420|nr:hypothetical protein [Tenacibaculum maritimum]MCD9582390.1 hypothetical protein [Tenacibaculum maritimum]MCD9636805.1 hypothetical protein [Tenacibaculum maritimum]CAA0222139.1 conserved hypothetical protein [Tenacibaculum maritimum]CAA0227316.1 conserved hypothetical protein [Tenacibaculum maritimum]
MRDKNKQSVATSSKIFFENGMGGHSAVASLTDLGNDLYIIKRTGNRTDLKIIVADIYIAGEAEVHEINPNLHNIDCIVLIGFYNRYSFAAKDLAKSMNVGLFDNREFFGAVNFTGTALVNYEKKKKKDD